jgi:hypothetical protein
MLPRRLEQIPMLHMDQIRLAKGFIMHKMYHYRYTGGGHTDISNLCKSCPEELKKYVQTAITELMREGLILRKQAWYGKHVYAIKNQLGYEYANAYRRHYNLDEEVYGRPYRPTKVQPLPEEVLRALKFKKRG